MRLGRCALSLALLLPLHAQETPHPNRVAWMSIFPEPMPEGTTQFALEATNQFVRSDRRDSTAYDSHVQLQAEDWEVVSDLAAPLGPGLFNLRTRLTYRSSGIADRLIMNWHNILNVSQAGRDQVACFDDVYHLERKGVVVFDLDKPRAQFQGLDLAYVLLWGDLRSGGRLGATVQLPTGNLETLQSSDGTNYLAGLAGWTTVGRVRFWAQAENIWLTLPAHSPLRTVVSRGAFWRAWAGFRYEGPGGSFWNNFGLDLSWSFNETPYRTGLVRLDQYGLQQTWIILNRRHPKWRWGFTEKGGTFSTPEITGFITYRP